jgi:hypothetical protein
MGWAARINDRWRERAVVHQIPHAHAGAYALASVVVSDLDGPAEVDLLVGPSGRQQEAARLSVSGAGEAILPEPQHFRGGAPLWFRASAPCAVAVRTADVVAERELSPDEAAVALARWAAGLRPGQRRR